ncbi:uncharacterized protein JCM6883_000213 [Sporobolomyces salmoneus]|uniref:uncharacterized protein n=1 Tax=Sporobolomyces salmoneus TaxID=183962 RepID=UPI00317E6906
MARFGLLDSDSEGASDASSIHSNEEEESTTERSRSISVPLSHSDDSDNDSQEDEELEDAPPRASLLSDDEEDHSGSAEEEEEEEDYSMDQQRTSRRSSLTPSQTPPPPTATRRKQLATRGGREATTQQQSPWAQQLKLEPKRVQVMQASFFGQTPSTSTNGTRTDREREREREETDREGKRRQVEQGFAQRAAMATATKTQKISSASLFPPNSTPIPQNASSTPAPSQPVPTPLLDPSPFRPYRTYTRVPLTDSITRNSENNLVDSGLALGKSYRVGWGPEGEIISLRGVYDKGETKSDVLKIEKLKLLSNEDKTSSLQLLELQLAHTEIYPSSHTDPSSSSPVPFASPSPSLRFHHFASLFTNSTSSSSSSETSSSELSNSPEAQYFKLASHLFDEVPSLGLTPSTLTPQQLSTLTSLRRRDLLSNWLSKTLLPSVTSSLHNPNLSPEEKIFLLLTAHELSQACDLALTSKNLRLATLISQIGSISSSGTDRGFQLDLEEQVKKWKDYKIDSHLSVPVRRIYELLSGNLGKSEGITNKGGKEDHSETFEVLDGVEWKAAFAIGLWYARNESRGGGGGAGEEDEVAKAVRLYEQGFKATPDAIKAPLSSHSVDGSTQVDRNTPLDPIYHLLKLYTCPTHSLEESLSPLNFGPSKTDYRLPWHLYLLFSRVLRRRDFEDRLEVDLNHEDEEMGEGGGGGTNERKEGNSVRADQVTMSYANQLESLGCWEWAVFVLLHLELEGPRAQAIQLLLSRHISSLTPSLSTFLLSTLHLPPFYLSRARALHAQSIGDVFSTYKHLLSSGETRRAHEIATRELVPEALVRGDEGLVRRLLEPFREDREDDDGDDGEEEGEFRGAVEGWKMGGKIFLQYLHTLSLFSSPSTSQLSTTAAYLSSTIQAVQRFSTTVNATKVLKGNRKLRMSISEMSSRLNVLAKLVGGRALNITQPSLLGESEKLGWLQGATKSFFASSLKRAGVTTGAA